MLVDPSGAAVGSPRPLEHVHGWTTWHPLRLPALALHDDAVACWPLVESEGRLSATGLDGATPRCSDKRHRGLSASPGDEHTDEFRQGDSAHDGGSRTLPKSTESSSRR